MYAVKGMGPITRTGRRSRRREDGHCKDRGSETSRTERLPQPDRVWVVAKNRQRPKNRADLEIRPVAHKHLIARRTEHRVTEHREGHVLLHAL